MSAIDKSRGQKIEAWRSVFVSFAAWAAKMAGKSKEELTVSYKPEKGKGSKDAPRNVTFATRHVDAVVAALRFNAFDQSLIDEETLAKYDLWDATKNDKGKVIGKKVAGKPIAEAIGVAKLLGCPITSLPTWTRKTKESKVSSFVVDVDADEMIKMLDAEAEAEVARLEAEEAEAKAAKGKKNGK